MEEELIEEVFEEIVEEAPSASEFFFNHVLPQLPPVAICLITLALVFVFLCAWKAPRWIKPVGSIAFSVALIAITWPYLTTFCRDVAANYQFAPMNYYWAGQKMVLVLLYGLSVFIISRVAYLIQKSRN
ncbi:MAG: hypothetical protein IKX55_04530 [Bacteroidaceae bacterium]|nr:hypothetical protein [Bacteroidaceae bacterium]